MDFPEKGLQYRILWYWFCDIIIFSSEADTDDSRKYQFKIRQAS